MDLGLLGKTAIVNGSSKGIGFATALALASEGVDLVMSARHQDQLSVAADQITALTSSKIVPVCADIRRAADCERILEEANKVFGGVDILINNDGAPPLGRLLTFSDDSWLKAFEQNVLSVVRMIRGAAPSMRSRDGGAIVNVTALTALEPAADFGLSASTWAAVHTLAKTLAIEFGGLGIRINTVCPGRLNSDRLRRVSRQQASDSHRSIAELTREHLSFIPLGRFGSAEEIADVIAFLASPRSSYLTGLVVPVDGGARRAVP
jgi:3-oxoacyl-[acyl-carrier protein] reductase